MVLTDREGTWAKDQQGYVFGTKTLVNDSSAAYLLGFEHDHVEPLPVKAYVRRLWLAFQSGKRSSLKFLDPKVESFSKEINQWVCDFVNDPDRLITELEKRRVVPLDEEEECEHEINQVFNDIADTILVERKWGDELWGHRKHCVSPLVNGKREPGDDKPPAWPQDKDRITLAVRQWMAARIQEKLQNLRDKRSVPRVQCPEDPEKRRQSMRTADDGIRYTSEELDVGRTLPGRVDAAILEPQVQVKLDLEEPVSLQSTAYRQSSARVADDAQSLSSRDIAEVSHSQGGTSMEALPDDQAVSACASALRPSLIDADSVATQPDDTNTQSASNTKRKHDEQAASNKRRKTAVPETASTVHAPTPVSSTCDGDPEVDQGSASPAPGSVFSLTLIGEEARESIDEAPSRPTTPVSQVVTHTVGNTNEQVHSYRKTTPAEVFAQPPCSGLTPPTCKCGHSLNDFQDKCRPDKNGRRQWKSTCTYCRPGLGLTRPSPCTCYRCLPATSGRSVTVPVSADGPHARQLTPNDTLENSSLAESSVATNQEKSTFLALVDNPISTCCPVAVSVDGASPTLPKDRVEAAAVFSQETVEHEQEIDFDQYLDPTADDSSSDILQHPMPHMNTTQGQHEPEQAHHPNSPNELTTDDRYVTFVRETNLHDVFRDIQSNDQSYTEASAPTTGFSLVKRHQVISTEEMIEASARKEKNARQEIVSCLELFVQREISHDRVLEHMIPEALTIFEMRLEQLKRLEDTAPQSSLISQEERARSRSQRRAKYDKIIQSLDCWKALLQKLREEGCLDQQRPRDQFQFFVGALSLATWLAKLAHLESWFREATIRWNLSDSSLQSLRHDLTVIFGDLLPETSRLRLLHKLGPAIDAYLEQLSDMFTLNSRM